MIPVDRGIYLVRVHDKPDPGAEPARYMAPSASVIEFAARHGRTPRAFWQFFGTDDERYDGEDGVEVEIVAQLIALREETGRAYHFTGDEAGEVWVDRP